MLDKPVGVHARAGDTTKQKALGFGYSIGFTTGIRRALDYYARQGSHQPQATASNRATQGLTTKI
jgi:hypothetical protein